MANHPFPSIPSARTNDIAFEDHGSLVLIRGLSKVGQTWLDNNVGDDETQHFGGAIVAEPRYVEAIAQGAADAGLAVRL